MLAQNFKTAAELGIAEARHATLVKVLGMFDRGEITDERFHMRSIGRPSCGTPACILGWCQHLSKDAWDIHAMPDDLIVGLFMFGDDRRKNINDPAQAAIALRSYLTTGDARWDLALAE